ncbi:polysaccharide deacetylase family protein [Halalkalibacterium halodurans]|jgi:probable sporulation protein (polysaccharide deacetylase family)|uniref:BH2406 protein n=1 Tax=Halalkalibacterium halodurans (strain ATCC BAA-125 / DSM 18197 / FERM 7344 / JCM 9153 / C-125) TaxID=272558 RepID=Q9KA84_HALH5|nr:polysaccharide deacetylase family protein [Halalkalibacterium halodurans]MED3646217.1 polysaccharide deacetylase family protein [Halalkalibacterium halodurans]MED4080071.1 polysaccharide deacetylase family protein [Halalkalibacterium halodurans]MED4086838.1 polysaccharide deacetylase family protein [Halalkalibacterium halodurans]MED4104250.1 polysaccharide deacetylase family protein [Halalkalibacterium halodurans]MED4110392.1 polysaccharide deacetylase family protein [Halalkalibacterium hal
MKKILIHGCVFAIILLMTYGAVQNPFSSQYIGQLKEEALPVAKMTDSLYEEIKDRAPEYEQPAIDAKIDRVWKAIPGYNGLEVDVESSYNRMKQEGRFDERYLVFRETKPSVHLDDLPPSPVFRGNPEKPMVTLLVNVAWGNEHLPTMLKTMNKYDVKSTFFLDGSWVKKHPQLATMIVEEGHEIGNHAYSHPDMQRLTRERMDEEIVQTNEVIKATIEVTPKWFAPPSGSYNDLVVQRAAEHGMRTIMWSVDTIDWRNPDPNEMVDRVLSKVHPGAMILMHPTESSAAGLENLIRGIQDRGLHIGTVSDLMDESRINAGVTP